MKEEKIENQNNIEDDKTLVDNNQNLSEENNENKIVDEEENEIVEKEEEKKSLKDKIISQKTALLVAGGSLAAGTALGSTIDNKDEVLIDTDNDNIADTILTDENQDGIYNIETENEEIEEIEQEDVTSDESSNSHTFNIDTAPHVSEGTVTDDMSFSEAFAAAREELGPGGVFEWNGQLYGTFYATEVDENHNPIIDYVTTEDDDYQPNTENQNTETVENENENQNTEENAEENVDENVEEITEVENAEDIDEIVGDDIVDTGTEEYDGEIASDVPDDVPDSELDDYNDDLIALNDDFDDIDDWA